MKHTMDEVGELISPHWPRREGQDKVDIMDAWPIIECGDGWADVLWHAHHIAKDHYPNYQVHQIKEKFGGLRFYASIDLVTEMMIENLAVSVCEQCGKFGNLSYTKSKHPWLATLCQDHRGDRYLTELEWSDWWEQPEDNDE